MGRESYVKVRYTPEELALLKTKNHKVDQLTATLIDPLEEEIREIKDRSIAPLRAEIREIENRAYERSLAEKRQAEKEAQRKIAECIDRQESSGEKRTDFVASIKGLFGMRQQDGSVKTPNITSDNRKR